MKHSDADHNADYWASKVKKTDPDAKAYWRRSQRNVDRIDNLKKLLARAHKELKNRGKD
tara:strand:+ start:628 stop:804 length:177 start_codon:yes stop_codon:yes gene_type:complete